MKLLVYGDHTNVLWHPVKGLQPWIASLQAAGHQVTVTEDYPSVTLELLRNFDICINYIDNWANRGSKEAEEVFCRYIAEGGRILSIHSGIIVKGAEKLLDIHGAAFHHHPEAEEITFVPDDAAEGEQKILLDGFSSFSIKEEPYMFDLRETPKKVYLWYDYRGERYPAAWAVKHGTGELVYIAPGHEARVVQEEQVQRLYNNALTYLTRQREKE